MDDYKKIIASIKNGDLRPIYFLHGEEAYYIDLIADYIADHILSEDEKSFNQSVLYGRDVEVEEVIASAKRYPLMAKHQVVILKEAQDLSRTIHYFEEYFKHPLSSTILVICYKYKKADGRKAYLKLAKKNGVVFESKPLYENQIPLFITEELRRRGYTIKPTASRLLAEFLGTHLGKINNELDKLEVILPKGAEVTPEVIEKNIGISKDYNNFELQNALGENDFKKAFRIIDYFAQNPKDNNILATLPMLYRYFSQLLKYHGLKDKSKNKVATTLGINPYFVKDYVQGARTFPMKKCSYAITVLRDVDVRVKGVGSSSNVSQGDFLKELLVKIAK